MVSITVLTPAFNAASTISRLASDLVHQVDGDFIWMIVDGGSKDGTLRRGGETVLPKQTVHVQEPDYGIYDAINKGLRLCTTTHYVVVGADDRLDPTAIAEYRRLAEGSKADIVAASVLDNGSLARPGRGKAWLRGQNAYISHHSVGTLISRRLHERFGYYVNSLPIAADQLFVKQSIQAGCSVHYAPGFVAGEFSREGVSSVRYLACLFEFTLVQMRTERSRGLQLLLLLVRLMRHWRKAIR